MKVILQRVSSARVYSQEEVCGEITTGYLLLVGLTHTDTQIVIQKAVNKIEKLRVFSDEQGKMNQSIKDVKGSILSISQFTLYGSTQKGNRPSFGEAMEPNEAKRLYEYFNELLREKGIYVATGIFGEDMQVELCNDGPVTLILEY